MHVTHAGCLAPAALSFKINKFPPKLNMPALAEKGQQGSKKLKKKAAAAELNGVLQHVKARNQEQDIMRHFQAFGAYSKDDVAVSISFCHASQLSAEQKETVWSLFEANMKDIYEKDHQTWNPKVKRRELFHDDARYFLAKDCSTQNLLGFTHFRFEVEDNLLSDDELQLYHLGAHSPVVYCYELQLDPCVTRKGVGKRLMQMLELTALRYKMDMVLLTVQRSNIGALAFYQQLGYQQHPSCPERNSFEDFDGEDPGHRIMWKDLRRKG